MRFGLLKHRQPSSFCRDGWPLHWTRGRLYLCGALCTVRSLVSPLLYGLRWGLLLALSVYMLSGRANDTAEVQLLTLAGRPLTAASLRCRWQSTVCLGQPESVTDKHHDGDALLSVYFSASKQSSLPHPPKLTLKLTGPQVAAGDTEVQRSRAMASPIRTNVI